MYESDSQGDKSKWYIVSKRLNQNASPRSLVPTVSISQITLHLSRFRVKLLQREGQSGSRVGCVLGPQVVHFPWLLESLDDRVPRLLGDLGC